MGRPVMRLEAVLTVLPALRVTDPPPQHTASRARQDMGFQAVRIAFPGVPDMSSAELREAIPTRAAPTADPPASAGTKRNRMAAYPAAASEGQKEAHTAGDSAGRPAAAPTEEVLAAAEITAAIVAAIMAAATGITECICPF